MINTKNFNYTGKYLVEAELEVHAYDSDDASEER